MAVLVFAGVEYYCAFYITNISVETKFIAIIEILCGYCIHLLAILINLRGQVEADVSVVLNSVCDNKGNIA